MGFLIILFLMCCVPNTFLSQIPAFLSFIISVVKPTFLNRTEIYFQIFDVVWTEIYFVLYSDRVIMWIFAYLFDMIPAGSDSGFLLWCLSKE